MQSQSTAVRPAKPEATQLPVKLETPPIASPLDAEVDIEILKTVPKQFAIDCADHANWLVKKIVGARTYAAHVKQWAEQELRRADREEATLLFLFGRQLEMWAKGQITNLHKRKSFALPAGTVGFRTVAAKLVIDDEQRVLAWARENCPAAIAVIEELSKTAIDEAMEKSGIVPDEGAHVEPECERFFIR